MRVLVVGAGGMLGRAVTRAAGADVVALPRSQLDVTDAAAVERAVAQARPDVVVNCAAFTDVDGAEERTAEAMRVNADGAHNVAAAAARVLYVSSDYVFDGKKGSPYVESDRPRPLSAYGRSKLAGERATAAANPRHFVARSSWLFGVGGKCFVDTMLRLGEEREELRVVFDQVGCPTYTNHLAEALLALAAGEQYGVHHVAARGSCSWFELARSTFERARIDCRLEPCTTEEYPLPARRPAYSVLASERGRRLPHWREGLDAYLGERRDLAVAEPPGART